MIEPVKEDIGRRVYYLPVWMKNKNAEYGIIKGFNKRYVHVRYGADTCAKSTSRRDLYWA